jgi:outer membrane protein assembly factor BamB
MAALDASNGSVLWSLEIPDLRRVNIPRDCSNWCVNSEHLFMAVQDRAWIHDAATGERVATLPVPGNPENKYEWGYIAHAGSRLFGSAILPEAAYTNYWGGDKWYDGKGDEEGTGKVCSDHLFAYDLTSRDLAWTYEKGLILNPSICVGDGKVCFVETRNTKLLEGKARQISGNDVWLDQYLVALDAETGNVLFEKPIDVEDGTVSFFMQYTSLGIITVTSNTQYHLCSFHPETGEIQWQNSKPWPDDHHSGHFQHPVVVNDKIYLQPNGYSLKTGEVFTSKVGERSGCHTYVGASDCLIYRGENRQIAMWDQKDETVSSWTRLRPSCWLSIVPSNGMLLVPEGGGGCSCGGWMETSLVFAPRTLLGYAPVAKGDAE